mgnify:CR=1 FL=1
MKSDKRRGMEESHLGTVNRSQFNQMRDDNIINDLSRHTRPGTQDGAMRGLLVMRMM